MALDMKGLFVNPADIRAQRVDNLMQQRQALAGLGGSMSGLLGQVAGGGNILGGLLAEGIAQQTGMKTQQEKQAEVSQNILGSLDPNKPETYFQAAQLFKDQGLSKSALALLTEGKRLADEAAQKTQLKNFKVVDTPDGKQIAVATMNNNLVQVTDQGAIPLTQDLGKGKETELKNFKVVKTPDGNEIAIATMNKKLVQVTDQGAIPLTKVFGEGKDAEKGNYVVVTKQNYDPESGKVVTTNMLVNKNRLNEIAGDRTVVSIEDLQGNTLGGQLTRDDIITPDDKATEQAESAVTALDTGAAPAPAQPTAQATQATQPATTATQTAPATTAIPQADTDFTIGSKQDALRLSRDARVAKVGEGAEKATEARVKIQKAVAKSFKLPDMVFNPLFDQVVGISPQAVANRAEWGGRGLGTPEGRIARQVEEDIIGNAIANAKLLGVNPTDKDFEASKRTMPLATDSAESWRDWVKGSFRDNYASILNSELGTEAAKPFIEALDKNIAESEARYKASQGQVQGGKTSRGINFKVLN